MAVPFAMVLAMVEAVVPAPTRHQAPRAIALEIARVAESPLEAARLVIVAKRESDFVPAALGDHGQALCAMQLQHAPARVLTDLRLCVEMGAYRLRASVSANPAHPFACYLSGDPRRAWSQSEDRERAARRLLD